MSDVNAFIDTVGRDVNATVVPKVHDLAQTISTKALNEYGPRVSAFTNQLVKDVIDEQSATIRDFITAVIQDVFQRYHPEIAGELHTTIKNGRLEINGQGVRLDLKRRDTGAAVASLDIPVSLSVKVDPLTMTVRNTTIRFDVVK